MASTGAEAMVSNEMGDLDGDSLRMHKAGRPGKIEIVATKPLVTQRDLALAYSPGVAAPCLEFFKDPSTTEMWVVPESARNAGAGPSVTPSAARQTECGRARLAPCVQRRAGPAPTVCVRSQPGRCSPQPGRRG